jgi:Sec-independent protein translocase protein TatA
MFGIGFTEIIVIVIVLLVFMKPEDLPSTVRMIGKLYGKWQRLYYGTVNDLLEISETSSKEKRK